MEVVGQKMNHDQISSHIKTLNSALGQVRAEYEADDELYSRYSAPLYVKNLLGITPAFLVGGRGTGKTTTLRSMSFKGQARIYNSQDSASWEAIGAYWKIEPNLVSAFKGKGIDDDLWISVFSHYLNLKLSSLVLDYARWYSTNGKKIEPDIHSLQLFAISLQLEKYINLDSLTHQFDLVDLSQQIDLALAEVEAKINGSISSLKNSSFSLPGKPLDYLFRALPGISIDRQRPFTFCLDEYENLAPYQQRILNTLVKQVGTAPYTFKIGVRNNIGIDRETLIENQPLQDTADFTTIDIVNYLKDESFEKFAAAVVTQRLGLFQDPVLSCRELLPGLSLEEEAILLGAEGVREEMLGKLRLQANISSEILVKAESMPLLDACMILRWSEAHNEDLGDVLRFALGEPKKWATRMGNYSYSLLFTLKSKKVGTRKYYSGWSTYTQIADGNIRYLIRLVYEALRLHMLDGKTVTSAISKQHQTEAAARVGETTIQDLQGWSRHGAALTRLSLGLGSYFGGLARERALSTPEISQFRVSRSERNEVSEEVEKLLVEAVGQGILVAFEENKNARLSASGREKDYQLHSVLAPYFIYSPRSKRRRTLTAEQVKELTVQGRTKQTVKNLLERDGATPSDTADQLSLFED